MKVNVLHEGDRVLNVTNEFVAVERVSGEADILPIIKEEGGMWIDTQHILTLGYGNNQIQIETEMVSRSQISKETEIWLVKRTELS